jgi:hypothetical protein
MKLRLCHQFVHFVTYLLWLSPVTQVRRPNTATILGNAGFYNSLRVLPEVLGNLLGDVKTAVRRLVLSELKAVEQLAAVSGGQLGAEPHRVHLMQPGQLNQPNVGLCQQGPYTPI